MRSSIALLAYMAFLSTSFARVLPKVKRDNTTCCGYALTNRGNTRFRYEHIIDFSTMTSLDQVEKAGWTIGDGWQTGGTNPATGQYTNGMASNVKLVRGQGITLTVPGGQSRTASRFSGAELTFPYTVLGGYFEVEAKVTKVAGTVFGIYTYHGDPWNAPLGWKDEQDIEILSAAIMTPTEYNKAGMQLTNHDPVTGNMIETVSPFPADPTLAFHKYSISWLPTLSCPALNQPGSNTKYRYDGNSLNNPVGGYSTHSSTFNLNLWTNADPKFSYGPPTTDAVVTIKQVRAWYDLPNKIGEGACPTKPAFDCTVSMACPVTVF